MDRLSYDQLVQACSPLKAGPTVNNIAAKLIAARVEIAELKRGSIVEYLRRQWAWSLKTFGPGSRYRAVIIHARKELVEIEQNPSDLIEWIDLITLGMDGYWRNGGTPETFMRDLVAKQAINFQRKWPVPTSEDEAVEHVREL